MPSLRWLLFLLDAGRYQNVTGQTDCRSCPTGTIHKNDVEGAASEEAACGDICGPGFFVFEETKSGNLTCRPCGRGAYQPFKKSFQCFDCPPGLAGVNPALKAVTECKSCPKGRFSPFGGLAGCLSCPEGYSTAGVNDTYPFEPVASPSPPPYAQRGLLANPIVIVGFLNCAACPRGLFASENGSAVCMSCPSGNTTTQNATSSIDGCIGCPEGTAIVNLQDERICVSFSSEDMFS